MVKLALSAVVLVATALSVAAYPRNHGPFAANKMPALFQSKECDVLEEHTPEGYNRPQAITYGLTNDMKAPCIRLTVDPESWHAMLSVLDPAGRTVCGPQRISDSIQWGGFGSVFCADLTRDGVKDYVAAVWLGGCGLATGYHNLAFVLSSDKGYAITTVTTMEPGSEDLVDLRKDGSCQFVHTSFVHGEKGRDGKTHNYWVYNLLEFKDRELLLANHLHPEFPKWIWYTHKPNHKATTQLTDEQKIRLWQEQGGQMLRFPAGNARRKASVFPVSGLHGGKSKLISWR